MQTVNADQQANSPIKSTGHESSLTTLTTNLRRKRFLLFKSLIAPLPRPLRILDVGGTIKFWEKMEFTNEEMQITVLNVRRYEITYSNFTSVIGDARNMKEFQDKEFDIVYSNSVIEHVGTFEQQRQMAEEIQRIGKRYFLQTPNRYFPIEPHFALPFFQFLPLGLRIYLSTHIKNGWGNKMKDKQKAIHFVSSIRLMREKELKLLFPGARIYKEKFFGLTKSFTVYGGW